MQTESFIFFCSGIRCVALHRQPINSWIPHAPESVNPPHHLCYWLSCPRESQRQFFLQCLHLLHLLVHHLLQAKLVLALMRVRRRKSHVEDDPCCSDHLFQLIKPCNSRVAAASAHVKRAKEQPGRCCMSVLVARRAESIYQSWTSVPGNCCDQCNS